VVIASGEQSPAEAETVLVALPDGRQLGVCQWGDPDGAALFVLHGSPGSRFLRHLGSGYVDHRLRVITYDRPGYGVSTRMPGHRVADAAAEVRIIADFLGLDRFAVAGISGGGPRALAAAALLPDRVTRCATVVSGAPFTAATLDFYGGMADDDRAGWQAAHEGGEALDVECSDTLEWAVAGLPGVTFGSEEEGAMLRDTLSEAFRQGVVGYRDDRLAVVQDWGFSLGDVRAPARIMLARGDFSIPASHGEWLMAHVTGATLVPVDGDHFGPRNVPEMQLMAWLGERPDDVGSAAVPAVPDRGELAARHVSRVGEQRGDAGVAPPARLG
jgi:pimeloyl-ACP methyl ester carboxylesterase